MAGSEQVRSSGHVFVAERRGGRVWFAKWRDAEGQHQRRLGPAWVKRTGQRTPRGGAVWRTADGPKPSPAYLTPQDAEARLWEVLVAAPVAPKGVEQTFVEAAEAWMEHGRLKRGLKRSTLKNYRQALNCYVLPDLGDRPLRSLKEEIERWHARVPRSRTGEIWLVLCRAVLGHAVKLGWLETNPSTGVERYPVRYSGDYDFYSPEDVQALVRAAANASRTGCCF